MKLSKSNALENHVKITHAFIESEAFKSYLALSRDSYPMGLGRLTALALHILTVSRTHFSEFELDRAVYWPADRRSSFADTLAAVGWAELRSPKSNLVEILLPQDLAPRRPMKDRATFRIARPRGSDGKFASQEVLEKEVLMYKNQKILFLDLDGLPVFDLESLSSPQKPSNLVRRRRRKGD